MTEALTDLARRFRFNEGLLGMVTAGFTAADWGATPTGQGGNTPHWIVGHLAASRRHLLGTIGAGADEEPWQGLFGMSAKPTSNEGYPEPAALIADFQASGERIAARLSGMTPAEAASEWGGRFPDGGKTRAEAAGEWGGRFPDGGKTRAEAAGFLYMHECYHLGQVGLLRRIRGYAGFA